MGILRDQNNAALRSTDGKALFDNQPSLGSIDDFSRRLRQLLPTGWFPDAPNDGEAENAPVLVSFLKGFGCILAGIWEQIQTLYLCSRLQTASGFFVDMMSEDYFGRGGLPRHIQEHDADYRQRIRQNMLADRNTRLAVSSALLVATGQEPTIIEPMNAADCHALGSSAQPGCGGGYGYGTSGLRYGGQSGQFFIETSLGHSDGVESICRSLQSVVALGVVGWVKVRI
ncbi:hypothetical protein [Neokomagataea thailandica]|uniref:Uncharacterized protein n=1 Tax=Neokomagataea tanensis NBRC 106556 TaxID=1223519 RepID=A0ABQ0QGS4_9PROT|nr:MULTISPECIES: hypothetical protein [Neokomagataea]GBR44238.1 hypothetical protein AA106556_0360 [Neokomagataea tanensis NBRC 106556]